MTIVYNGLMQPCIGQRQSPAQCHNFATTRAESDHAIVHLCDACVVGFAKGPEADVWTFTRLTGRDVMEGTPSDPIALMRDTPWVLEVDGIKREDVIS